MVTARVVRIRQRTTGRGDGEKAYVIEFSLPQYSETFETDPIPEEEYDRETATDYIQDIASELVAKEAEITVEFPGENWDDDGIDRRDLMKYGLGGVLGLGSLGGVAAFFQSPYAAGLFGDESSNSVADPGTNPVTSSNKSHTDSVSTPTGTAPSTPTGSPTPTSTASVIDDFESGELESAWRNEFDTSTWRTGHDGGRAAFSVQSEIAPQGTYALRGNRELYSDGTSTILRDDFIVEQEGATIRLYLQLGPILDGYERGNKLLFYPDDYNPDGEEARHVLYFRNKPGDWNGYIASEKLKSPRLVEIRDISFADGVVSEVAIGGDVVEQDVKFATNSDNIGAVGVWQGHYDQPADIIVDEIAILPPD